MRRLASHAVLCAVLAACSPDEPTVAGGSIEDPHAVGLAVAAVRDTVLEFLETYADTRASGKPLSRLVAGRDLEDWVHWVTVQNRGLDLLPRGDVDVRMLRVVELSSEGAVVELDATVSIVIRGEDGEPEESRRVFSTPMVLARTGDGPDSWAVVEAVRDGRSMRDSISTITPPVAVRGPEARLEVVSVYRFTGGTVVNVRIQNAAGRPLRVDHERSVLLAGVGAVTGLAMTASFHRPIPPGTNVEGAVTFPPLALTDVPQGVALYLDGAADPEIGVELPPEAFAS